MHELEVRALMPHDLKQLDFLPEGLRAEISFPLSAIDEPPPEGEPANHDYERPAEWHFATRTARPSLTEPQL